MPSNRRGKAKLSSYGAWADMLQRCKNPKLKNYHRYGGRGIKVCDRWSSFDNFYADMGDKPAGYSLGRQDNDGDYSPDNCQWETRKEQSLNKSTTRWVEWRGERKSVTEWAIILNVNRITLSTRLNRGWSIEEAFTFHPFVKGKTRESEVLYG